MSKTFDKFPGGARVETGGGDLLVRGVETSEELRLANDLMAKIFHRDYFEAWRWLESSAANYPGFLREHTRVALWRGNLAGTLRINTETIRIGEARLKMGGFGYVATSPDYRHKGIGRALMLDGLAYMAQHNYHVSMLFGIPNFYHRFGFCTTLSEYATTVDVLEASEAYHPDYRIRDGKPGDIRAIQKLHATNDGDIACSLLRTAAHITNRWERWKTVRVLTNAQGRIVGYFLPRAEEDVLSVEEVGVEDAQACGAVLHACAAAARKHFLPRIRFHVPPQHPFTNHLIRYRSIHETRMTRDGGGMMALVNLGETLESMIPEWESLLQVSAAREFRTEVTFVIDGAATYRVRVNRGAVDIANSAGKNKLSLSSRDLLQLLTGYRFLDEILNSERRILTLESRQLLASIFPKRTPYVWLMDRF
ncbi:MAG: GNAT family N-acetyltransferase [Candidatus Hydrogenedentes bacterium]|nr:GNAT family N-acetyltransferase [Candidatus Hydrogenedentota bacterium]